jgi:UDP:flavonoid glycosyltransferase YjiC (YdhE family)
MSRILVITQPELGHMLPILPIAEQLLEHGHDVLFMCTQETQWLFNQRRLNTAFWAENADASSTSVSYFSEHIPSGRSVWYEFARRSGGNRRHALRMRLEVIASQYAPEHFIVDNRLALSFGLDLADYPFRGQVTLVATSLGRWDEPPAQVRFPLLFLCPKEFEVPSYVLKAPLVKYVEPSCSQPYSHPEDDPVTLNQKRSMVLVTFGTQGSLQSSFMERLRAINELALSYRDIAFIVGLSQSHIDACAATGFRMVENVQLRTRIPQRALLDQALMLVTHGGLSSMKEAILAGVPMIVTPEVFDQPFNAMRAVYHRLAPAIFPDEMNTRTLEAVFGNMVGCSSKSEEICRFQSIFEEADSDPQATRFIEDQLRSQRRA